VIGGFACILHGLVRNTEDVDILVEPSSTNLEKVIGALSELPDGAAKELTITDLEDNMVVKVADSVEVDISKKAWTLTFNDAWPSHKEADIAGVNIPYLSLDDLITSKATPRAQDQLDQQFLLRLKNANEEK